MAKGVGNSWSIYTEPGRPAKRASLGDFEDCQEALNLSCWPKGKTHRMVFYIPELLGGNDYSGDLVNKANHRAFLEKFGRLRGVHDLYGGFGTFGVAINQKLMESNEELRDVLNKLENYPLVDEETHSEMEAEGIESAWKDWGASDFLRAIQQGHESLAEFEPEGLTQKLGLVDLRHHLVTVGDSDLPDDKLRFFFEDCREEAAEYWGDDGGSMFIRMEKVAPFAVDRLLVMLTPRLQLPLLLGRDWSSKEAFNEFEKRLRGD